jgi:hypothetical protein
MAPERDRRVTMRGGDPPLRTRLGRYEVLDRARDTGLHRDVALKVLPAELSSDPVRLTRFERLSSPPD